MEDDDDHRRISLQVVVNSLYCHEEPLLVSTPPPPPPHDDVLPPPQPPPAPPEIDTVAGGDLQDEQQRQQQLAAAAEEEEEEAVRYMVARQGCYAPSRGYLHHLLMPAGGGVAAARSRGVQYIIYVVNKLGLAASTAFNAVNYLDRFLSINCHLRWDEAWMVELVSVACLSVACKLDEVNIPSLHHLQMEEVLEHSFRSGTVRDMELTLLKALQWRLACVTPYSFLHLIMPPSSPASGPCTRLLLRSLEEPSLLLRFDPPTIASSAIRCLQLGRLHHHHHQQQQDYSSGGHVSSRLLKLLMTRPSAEYCPPTKDDDDDDECFKMMQALLDQESCCLLDHLNSSHCRRPYIVSDDEQLMHCSSSPAVNRSASVVTRRCLFDDRSAADQPS